MNELLALAATLFLMLWITVLVKKPRIITWEEMTKKQSKPKKKTVKEVEEDDDDDCVPDGAGGSCGGSSGSGIAGSYGESYVSSTYLDRARAQIHDLQRQLDQQNYETQQALNQLQAQRQPCYNPIPELSNMGAKFHTGDAITHKPSGERAIIEKIHVQFIPRDYTYEWHYDLSNGMITIPEGDLV